MILQKAASTNGKPPLAPNWHEELDAEVRTKAESHGPNLRISDAEGGGRGAGERVRGPRSLPHRYRSAPNPPLLHLLVLTLPSSPFHSSDG